MRKLLFLCILFLIGLIGKTQKVYFIYLESENAIPFYVKMGDRIYSSSPAGYLILSNLVDSTYGFSIGLSGKREVEPKFRVAVSGSDLGFIIKEQEQKLHLFDLQSQELIAPLTTIEISTDTYITRDDIFTRTLSLAVNDPSLTMEVVRKEPAKTMVKGKETPEEQVIAVVEVPETNQLTTTDSLLQGSVDSTALASAQTETQKTDTTSGVVTSATVDTTSAAILNAGVATADTGLVVDKIAVIDTVAKKDTVSSSVLVQTAGGQDSLQNEVIKAEEGAMTSNIDSANHVTEVTMEEVEKTAEIEYKKSTVIRHSESSTTTGFGLTYIDVQGATTDTIRIIIPNPKLVFKTSIEAAPQVEMPKTIADIEATAQVDTVAQQDVRANTDSIPQADTETQKDTIASIKKPQGNCNTIATEQDFKDLRKDMASLYTDAGMVNTAVSSFREKCFSTEQVKNLSTLFLTAQWKYFFFEAVQKYVADTENFASLESEIKDDYYLNKFKALIAK